MFINVNLFGLYIHNTILLQQQIEFIVIMKELSIKEKAKAYDEAIAVINKSETDKYGCIIGINPSDIFPELKESNDEKVKRILHSISSKISSNLRNIFTEEEFQCFDTWSNVWLKKQGEQKPVKTIIETWKDMRLEVYQQASGNRHEPNYSDDTTKLFSLNDIDEIIGKISEQKPAEKVEPKFKVGDKIIRKELGGDFIHNPHIIIQVDMLDKKYRLKDGLVAHFSEEDDWELIEQNPAWSEEDEEIINNIGEYLNCYGNYIADKNEEKAAKIYKSADWLKPLKARYAWKPSDEQMRELKHVFDCSTLSWDEDILESLYNDLKKLMEERV